MLRLNLQAAWLAILLGFLFGAVQGIFFHNEAWFGGYGSWRRRLMRLGHVSFFGLAFINFAFVFTSSYLHLPSQPVTSILFIAALVLMPLVCYLAAWKDHFRKLFFLPVGSLLAGAVLLIAEMF